MSQEVVTPRRSRENCFDVLRLFAATCVVVQHATIHLDGKFFWYEERNHLWFTDGVLMFFILSGGMVYQSAERCLAEQRPLRDYLRNRALRIAPAVYAYLAVMTVLLLVLGVIGLRDLAGASFLTWFASTLALAPVYHPAIFHDFGVGVVNGSLWTIPVEVGFYLLVPILVVSSRRWGFRRMITVVILAALSGAIAYAILGGASATNFGVKMFGVTFVPWLIYFTIGLVMNRVWRRLPQHALLAVSCGLVYAVCTSVRGSLDAPWSELLTLVSAIPLAYTTFWIGHHGPRALAATTRRVGDLSFGVYIWHMPVINAMIWFGLSRADLGGTGAVLTALAVTLLLAAISWHAIEKTALRFKRYDSRRVLPESSMPSTSPALATPTHQR
ncbi:acyltransferase family protein [Krasilnikovia sp. M28-CT-15]|uniref:acyltransferase family protein n=1 Tax=Krasilnikovia sp. M28-CT-15 TaxID=3373540 RepID=UPI003875D9E6